MAILVVAINVQQGLAKLRQPWIDARNDSEELDDRSSAYTRERLADDGWTICVLPAC